MLLLLENREISRHCIHEFDSTVELNMAEAYGEADSSCALLDILLQDDLKSKLKWSEWQLIFVEFFHIS